MRTQRTQILETTNRTGEKRAPGLIGRRYEVGGVKPSGRHAAGVEIALDGDDLRSRSLLTPAGTRSGSPFQKQGWDCRRCCVPVPSVGRVFEDWQVYFDERCRDRRVLTGASRVRQTEAQAFACCLSATGMNRASGDIVSRVVANSPVKVVTGPAIPCCPMGRQRTAMPGCIPAAGRDWHETRKAEAIDALEVMGIEKPTDFPNDFGKTWSSA